MAEPRKILLPFAAIAAATAIAAMEQTLASLFPATPPSSSMLFFDLGRFDNESGDVLVRSLARAEQSDPWDGVDGFEEIGRASWYGQWHHGRTTASGEKFDMNKLTAAHRSLPLGTNVRVTNLENGRTVDVTINDRGPYVGTRVIDLSRGAARKLRMEREGLAPVLIEETRADSAATTRTASGSTD
jgi:rare lipoprotein A